MNIRGEELWKSIPITFNPITKLAGYVDKSAWKISKFYLNQPLGDATVNQPFWAFFAFFGPIVGFVF